MSKVKAATMSGQRVLSYVERVERLEDERKGIGGDIRDVYSEAKSNGYDAKTIRWLVQERKVDVAARDERDALRDAYACSLGMAVSLVQVNGLSLREAAKQTGLSKSSIHRALSVPEASQPASPTGEVIQEPRSPARSGSDSAASNPVVGAEPDEPPREDGLAGERGHSATGNPAMEVSPGDAKECAPATPENKEVDHVELDRGEPAGSGAYSDRPPATLYVPLTESLDAGPIPGRLDRRRGRAVA